MDADVAYFVTYPCPKCQLDLEAEHGGWQGWMRCPSCGTPSLPPEILLGHPDTRRRIRGIADNDDVDLVIESEPSDDRPTPVEPLLVGPAPSALITTLRIVFLAGLVLSLFVLLIAFLDENRNATLIFGGLSIVFFLLLLRLPARLGRGR